MKRLTGDIAAMLNIQGSDRVTNVFGLPVTITPPTDSLPPSSVAEIQALIGGVGFLRVQFEGEPELIGGIGKLTLKVS